MFALSRRLDERWRPGEANGARDEFEQTWIKEDGIYTSPPIPKGNTEGIIVSS